MRPSRCRHLLADIPSDPTLAALYEQVPRWGHVALDFEPGLLSLLEATAVGLAETMTE